MQMFRRLRIQGNSVGFTVPFELARAWDLRVGDSVLWEAQGDTVTLKFFRLPRASDLEKQGEEAAVDAA